MYKQLDFDELMNIQEGGAGQAKERESVVLKPQMVNPCYYCLCDSCINNVENIKVRPDEIPDRWESCFFCDDCRKYDNDTTKRNMEREKCSRYSIDNYHARQKRKKIRAVKVQLINVNSKMRKIEIIFKAKKAHLPLGENIIFSKDIDSLDLQYFMRLCRI